MRLKNLLKNVNQNQSRSIFYKKLALKQYDRIDNQTLKFNSKKQEINGADPVKGSIKYDISILFNQQQIIGMNQIKNKGTILDNAQTQYKIQVNQQKQSLDSLFSQFKEDLKMVSTSSVYENSNFLTPSVRLEKRQSKQKREGKKRMKLIDYIYIKNTAKKNQKSSKIDKSQMPASELKKSRMKEGKEKAFKSIVDEMITELKHVSQKANAIASLIEDNVEYTGSTDDIAKLCTARRMLQQKVFTNLKQIQRTLGFGDTVLTERSRQRQNVEQQDNLEERLKRLEMIGVKRLDPECQNQIVRHHSNHQLKVQHQYSNKDTWISEKDQQRQEP